MKFFNKITKREILGMTGGLVGGVFIALAIFSYAVPSGMDMIQLYYPERFVDSEKTGDLSIEHTNDHHMDNKYMMGDVKSEKQFLEEMIMHHEAAVIMARQVLALNPKVEINKLASDIIKTQTAEIKMMKDWLTSQK